MNRQIHIAALANIAVTALVPVLLAEWVFALANTEQLTQTAMGAFEVLWRSLTLLPPLTALTAACSVYHCRSVGRIALALLASVVAYILPAALFFVSLRLSAISGTVSILVIPIKVILGVATGIGLIGGPALVAATIAERAYQATGRACQMHRNVACGDCISSDERCSPITTGDWVVRTVSAVVGSVGMLSLFWYTNAADTLLAMVIHYLVPGAVLSAISAGYVLRDRAQSRSCS